MKETKQFYAGLTPLYHLVYTDWDAHGSTCDVTMCFVEDRGKLECTTHALRSTYYAVGIPKLMHLMRKAGFEDVKRIDGRFFQPVIIGTRKTQQGKSSVRAKPRR